METLDELVSKFELTPDAVLGVVNVFRVAIVDAYSLPGVPRVPLEQFTF